MVIHARRALLRVLVVLVLCVPGAARALGDGKMFSVPTAVPATIPDQSALIVWRDGVETLVIETSFEGGGKELAWVVPTPAIPTVEATTPGLFSTLRSVFLPRITGLAEYTFVAARLIVWMTAFLLVVGYVLRPGVSNAMRFVLLALTLLS